MCGICIALGVSDVADTLMPKWPFSLQLHVMSALPAQAISGDEMRLLHLPRAVP